MKETLRTAEGLDIIHRSIKVQDEKTGYKVHLGDEMILSFPHSQDGKQLFEAAEKVSVIFRKGDTNGILVKIPVIREGSEGEVSVFVKLNNFIINCPEQRKNFFQKSYEQIKKGFNSLPSKLIRQEV